MSFRRLLVHTVTIVRAPTVENRYADQAKDWADATRITHPAWIAQRTAVEGRTSSAGALSERPVAVSDWLLYLLPTATVDNLDRVEWPDAPGGAAVFEVVGPPTYAGTPRGVHHIEAPLRRVVG